jgi:hypothetical protein
MPSGRVPSTGQFLSTAVLVGHVDAAATSYVNKIASDGWLQGRHETTHALVPLAKYTEVRIINTLGERTTFKVMDGPHAGKLLSLSEANARLYLGPTPPVRTPATIEVTYGKYVPQWHSAARRADLDQQMATLKVNGVSVQVTMNTNWGGSFFPLPPGDYAVLVPDAPHNANMTRFYRDTYPKLVYDQVWFPIKFGDNSRFVHVGNVSDGCVTVLDMDRWPEVHEAIISHRSPDGSSVARISVKGTPERAR